MAEKITRVEAVKRALDTLGPDANRGDIQTWVKDQFDYEMSLDQISNCKSTLAGKKEAGPKTAEAKPAPAPAPNGDREKISKKEAVRRSLATLGKKASPVDIQKDIKERFGIDMNTGHISTTKGELRREGKKKPGPKKAALKPQEQAAASPPVQPAPAPARDGKKASVEIDDILALRALLDRVGVHQLRTLIDVLAR